MTVGVAIIGTGGHARVIQDVLMQRDGHLYTPYHSDDVPDGMFVCLGVGNKPKIGDSGLALRRRLYEQFGVRIMEVHSPTVNVRGMVGHGTQILTNAIVQIGSVLGDNVLINTAAVIEHDCFIGDHTHIAPGALLCGGVRIGTMTHIGARAVVKQGVRVGNGCVIGMGAVVRKDVADGETVW